MAFDGQMPSTRRIPRAGRNAATTSGSPAGDDLGALLLVVRRTVRDADPDAVEDRKWKKPSNPDGVPVWSDEGILFVIDELKGRLRLTFPKGASLPDPTQLFNTRLDSRTVRAIDFPAGSSIDVPALRALIRAAASLNKARAAG